MAETTPPTSREPDGSPPFEVPDSPGPAPQSAGPDAAPPPSVNLEVRALPPEPAPAVAIGPAPRPEPASGRNEPKVRKSDQPPNELKGDPAGPDRRPDKGPSPSAISEIPAWVPLAGGFGALPAKAVARGGLELWQKTRVAASALGAAPLGILLLGAGLHRARRRRPAPWSQDAQPGPGAELD